MNSFSQQENTLYFMERIPQSQYLNPANHPDCKWWMGGLIIPVWLSPMIVPPVIHVPMYMDISVPFALNDVIKYENNKPKETYFLNKANQDVFLKKLSPINNISNNFTLEWLNFGFKIKKSYWSFSLLTKENVNFSFPKELFAFPLNGNMDTVRENNGVFNGLGLNASVYEEASIGFNHQFSKYFRVGLRVKALYGIANINTAKSEIKIKTISKTDAELLNSNTFTPYTVESNLNLIINTSIPMVDIKTDTNKIPKSVSIKDGYSPADALKMKNFGWGLDFGFQKDWNSELTMYGSIIDLGFIKWKTDVQNFGLSGKLPEFTGIDLKVTKDNYKDLNSSLNVDTLLKKYLKDYNADTSRNSYKTMLNTKVFLGGNYKLSKRIAVGLLGRVDKYPFNYEYSATASLNFKPFKWGALTLSTSYMKKSFANYGIGYTIRIGPVQWYAVYDNLIGAAVMPERARYFSVRWGVNLVFGRGKKKIIDKNTPLLNTL